MELEKLFITKLPKGLRLMYVDPVEDSWLPDLRFCKFRCFPLFEVSFNIFISLSKQVHVRIEHLFLEVHQLAIYSFDSH